MTTKPRRGPRELPREVRIIGGQWKRTKLPVADRPGLRPTPDRVRETLFNWLGQDLSGWRCIDAFAGSGALGFEAASRGAAEVVLLERDPVLVSELRATQQRLGAATTTVERVDALTWLARSVPDAFDLVFLDPPFDDPRSLALALVAAARVVRVGGFVYAESSTALGAVDGADRLEPWRSGRAGSVHFHLLRARDFPSPPSAVDLPASAPDSRGGVADGGYTARDLDAWRAT